MKHSVRKGQPHTVVVTFLDGRTPEVEPRDGSGLTREDFVVPDREFDPTYVGAHRAA